MPTKICTLLILLSFLATSRAADHEPLENIRDAVEAEALHRIDDPNAIVRVGRIDRRLKLQRCAEALETEPGPGGVRIGRSTIAVRCNTPRPWSLYVPVTIGLRQRVVVAARPLRRGETLAAADLRYREQELKRASHRFFTDKQSLLGKEVTRRIASGMAIRSNQVRRPLAVRRGARVTILSSNPGLEVRMAGKALDDGAIGDPVRVRNIASGRGVEATVVSPGTVRVH